MMHGKRALAAALILLTLTANDDDDRFDRTIAALQTGLSTHGRPARDAGATLIAVGAKPVEGADLGLRWSKGRKLALYRDRALGPGYRAVSLDGGRTAHFEQVFLAGQRAHVALVALDQTAFTLEVSDDQGVKQCQRTINNRCIWVPLWTTRYRIDVVNPGTRAGSNYLVMQ